MKTIKLLSLSLLFLGIGALIYFLFSEQLGPAAAWGIVIFYTVMFFFAITAARIGKNRKDKGRIFFWGGVVILCVIVPLSSILISISVNTSDNEARIRIDAARNYFMVCASVFGLSSISRGIQYFADYDLDEKSKKTSLVPNSTPPSMDKNPQSIDGTDCTASIPPSEDTA